MALVFITGVAGSGKSTVLKELRCRGYEAYDTDDDGFAKWQHKQTGHIHPKSSIKPSDRTKKFLKEHSWNIPRSEVEELAKRAKHKIIFLCGAASNEQEVRDLFKGMFELTIDEGTLRHQLLTRSSNDWGKQPHELKKTLEELRRSANDLSKKSGYVIIDATQPVSGIADKILESIKKQSI
jgi:shikimate kinase